MCSEITAALCKLHIYDQIVLKIIWPVIFDFVLYVLWSSWSRIGEKVRVWLQWQGSWRTAPRKRDIPFSAPNVIRLETVFADIELLARHIATYALYLWILFLSVLLFVLRSLEFATARIVSWRENASGSADMKSAPSLIRRCCACEDFPRRYNSSLYCFVYPLQLWRNQ
jgi:hypothetical protein